MAIYRMLVDGESPQYGKFSAGDVLELPVEVGTLWITRGIAEEVI